MHAHLLISACVLGTLYCPASTLRRSATKRHVKTVHVASGAIATLRQASEPHFAPTLRGKNSAVIGAI